MILEFSKEKDGEKNIEKNFKIKEFACKDGTDKILIDENIPKILQWLRDRIYQKFKKEIKIIVVSAYRTTDYNKQVGGAERSMHIFGRAVDIKAEGLRPSQIINILEEDREEFKKLSIGLYEQYIHIDTRCETGASRHCWVGKINSEIIDNFFLDFLCF